MAESVVLEIEKRVGNGSLKARKLRAAGKVPGVVYGHKQDAVSIAIDADRLMYAIRHGARVLDLQVGKSAPEKVLIREVQWDHLGKDLLHVDFARVSADERIKVSVPIELRGIAPGVTGGGVLDQPLHVLHVECLAIAIPESIRVNINELQLDAAIHVKELKLPDGVTALDDEDAIVVHVTAPKAEPEPGAVEPGATAEPERIGRVKAEEEAEEK
jgi:large subunit ribosomal protein L25